MTALTDLFDDADSLWKIQSTLQSIANMDSSREARELAEKYLNIIEGKNTL